VILGTGFGLWHRAKYTGQSAINATISQQAPQPTPPVKSLGIDVSAWKTLTNKYSWSVKYPASWDAEGDGGESPENDIEASLQGPRGCFEQDRECGYLSVGIWAGSINPNDKTRTLAALSPKAFILATAFPTPPSPDRVLMEQGDLLIDGAPAYYVLFRQKNFENYPNGIIMKKIEVKTQGKLYSISYYETAKNKPLIASIGSPNDWQLNPIFEEIISTIRFSH